MTFVKLLINSNRKTIILYSFLLSSRCTLCRFCEDLFHTFVNGRLSKHVRCPVFRRCQFSKGLYIEEIKRALACTYTRQVHIASFFKLGWGSDTYNLNKQKKFSKIENKKRNLANHTFVKLLLLIRGGGGYL